CVLTHSMPFGRRTSMVVSTCLAPTCTSKSCGRRSVLKSKASIGFGTAGAQARIASVSASAPFPAVISGSGFVVLGSVSSSVASGFLFAMVNPPPPAGGRTQADRLARKRRADRLLPGSASSSGDSRVAGRAPSCPWSSSARRCNCAVRVGSLQVSLASSSVRESRGCQAPPAPLPAARGPLGGLGAPDAPAVPASAQARRARHYRQHKSDQHHLPAP